MAIQWRIHLERFTALRRNFMRVSGIAAAGIALAMSASACGSSSSSSSSGSAIKIGFMGDLSGAASADVIGPWNGANLAVDAYNATKPKVKITLVKYDSQGDPTQATNLATKSVTTDKIVALIGPAFSGESKAVDPILEQAQVPSVSESATNASLSTHGWKYWHRIVTNDDVQGPAAADFASKGLGSKKAFVVDDKSAYGGPIAAAVKAALTTDGVSVVGTDSVDPKAVDYSTTVAKVKASGADFVYYGGYYQGAGKLLKQLREGGVKTAAFASGDGSRDPGLITAAGAANVTNTYATCPCLVAAAGSATGAMAKFQTDYKAKFGSDPSIYSAEGYDVASLYIAAVKAGKITGPDINTYLSTADFQGVSKEIKFAPTGEPATKQIYIYQFNGATNALDLLGPSTTAKPKA
jgi:branched-chain amino acid transport system substrate-binding protein